ncbi:MAG: DNA polymerase III subunit epsilon [Pseudomonadota bacterium]
MREIILDTETTGLEAMNGDRIVEIGCVETINHAPTGEVFHVYLNPERAMSADSIRITGLTDDFLADKPVFAAIQREFLEFLGDAPLVIHNAAFDMRFLNMELTRARGGALSDNRVVDTLAIAKKRFPGAQVSLDALCRRFNVDNSGREKHGALLDAELLAEVYLELRGGRQPGLALAASAIGSASATSDSPGCVVSKTRPPRKSLLTESEAAAHAAFVESLGDESLWPRAE